MVLVLLQVPDFTFRLYTETIPFFFQGDRRGNFPLTDYKQTERRENIFLCLLRESSFSL